MNITTTIKKITIILVLVLSSMTLASQDGNTSKKDQESSYILSVKPSFPGGEEALVKFIEENNKYKDAAKKPGTSSYVHVQVLVRKDGTIAEPKILRGIGSPYNEEALRVISIMPSWNPGVDLKGDPVDSRFIVTIAFFGKSSKRKTGWGMPEDHIYMMAEIMPEFPGGYPAFTEYLTNNIKYPKAAIEIGVEGKIYVKFVVKMDGSIDKTQIVKGLGSGCDEEAIRVIESVPIWIPGEQMGKLVNVWYTVAFNFQIDKEAEVKRAESSKPLVNNHEDVSEDYEEEYMEVDVPEYYEEEYMVEEEEEPIYMVAQITPEFPGGQNAFAKYLQDSIQYPKMAIDDDITGIVYVKFIVRKNGAIDKVQVIKGIGGGCDEEAMRVLKSIPKWIPGENMGKLVNVWFTVPVNFQIDKELEVKKAESSKPLVNNHEDVSEDYEEGYLEYEEEEEEGGPIVMMAEKMPEFPGGSEAFVKFLQKNISYPKEAIEKGVEGKVYLKFIVKKDGSIDNIQVLKGIGMGCDEEAVRVIKNGPKWIPGENMGKPVNEGYIVPVKFQL